MSNRKPNACAWAHSYCCPASYEIRRRSTFGRDNIRVGNCTESIGASDDPLCSRLKTLPPVEGYEIRGAHC
jgi:hypothetical protein